MRFSSEVGRLFLTAVIVPGGTGLCGHNTGIRIKVARKVVLTELGKIGREQ